MIRMIRLKKGKYNGHRKTFSPNFNVVWLQYLISKQVYFYKRNMDWTIGALIKLEIWIWKHFDDHIMLTLFICSLLIQRLHAFTTYTVMVTSDIHHSMHQMQTYGDTLNNIHIVNR